MQLQIRAIETVVRYSGWTTIELRIELHEDWLLKFYNKTIGFVFLSGSLLLRIQCRMGAGGAGSLMVDVLAAHLWDQVNNLPLINLREDSSPWLEVIVFSQSDQI